MSGFRQLSRNHDFTVLWIAQTTSELGSQVSLFVVPLLTYALTGSTLLAGLAGGADLLGTAVGLLPGGLLADRVDRRRLLRIAAAVGALAYASVAVAALAHHLSVTHLIGAGFTTGVATGVFTPAETAAVRTVVSTEELPTALSQMQARQHIATLVGGPLGGVLYSLTRWVPFAVDAVSFSVCWVLLGRLRSDLSPSLVPSLVPALAPALAPALTAEPAAEPGGCRGAGRDLAEGFAFTWSRPLFRTLLLWGAASNLVVNALFTTATLRLIQAGFAPWSIGLVSATAGLAGVLGALVAPKVIERFPTGVLAVAVGWSFVPMLVPLAVWNSPVVVGAGLGVLVFLNPIGNAGMGSYKTAVTPPELIGRVSATSQLASWSVIPLAPVLAGALLSALGGTVAVATLGALVAVVAMVPTASRTVRSVPRPSQWRVEVGVDWAGAGGGQRLCAGQATGPRAEGPDRAALGPARAPAGDA